MPIAPGTRLGPYVVNTLIGVGGMGEVYQATDTSLARPVAIKVLPESMAADVGRLARFEREAKTLAALNHPNIALIYGVERSDGQFALVMELVEGETLADRIARGPMPVDDVLAIGRQIASALEAAHEQGIVHRDLKPANIKVRPDGQTKVLDFGLAKAMEPTVADGTTAAITSPALMTGVGTILGTAAYMAPEQAKGRSVDKRADIWAFGVILYEMVTGTPLFAGETVVETLAAVVTKSPDLALAPASVRPLLQATLEPDPRRRLRDVGDAFRLVDTSASIPGPSPRAGQSRPLVIGLGAMVVAALLLAVFAWTRQPSTATPDPLQLQINLPPGAQPDAGMALSPDGRRLAFIVADAKGQQSVWMRELASFEARQVPGTENVFTVPLFWSPDSRWLGFASGGGLQRVNVVEGGAPIVVVRRGEIGADWNAEGTIVFGSNPSRGTGGSLFRVSAAGGEPVPLTVVDTARGEYAHHHPTFLPDGRRFLYLRTMRPQEGSGIYVGSLDTQPENQSTERLIATEYGPVFFVPSQNSTSGLLFYLRNQTLLAHPERVALTGDPIQVASPVGTFIDRALYFVSRNGTIVHTTSATVMTRQLTWVDRDGNVLNTVGSPATIGEAALAPDGTKAAVTIPDLLSPSGRSDLWIWDLARGTQTLLSTGVGRFSPTWSPDSTRVAYTDGNNLYERPVTALEDARLLLRATPGDQIRATSWSPDGRVILVDRENPKTSSDIWAVTRADDTAVPLIGSPRIEREARYSPDGKWIAYVANEGTGQSNVYVTAVDMISPTLKVGGGPWRVSSSGGTAPRWRADSRAIYYAGPASLMTVPVFTDAGFTVGPATPLPAFESDRLTLIDIAADGNRLLDARAVDTPTTRAPVNVLLNWRPPDVR